MMDSYDEFEYPKTIYLHEDNYDVTWSDEPIDDDDEPYYRHCVVSALERENTKLRAQLAELRAELARIKPSWDDAPEWATSYFCTAFWYEGEKERHKYLCDFVEGRPESE